MTAKQVGVSSREKTIGRKEPATMHNPSFETNSTNGARTRNVQLHLNKMLGCRLKVANGVSFECESQEFPEATRVHRNETSVINFRVTHSSSNDIWLLEMGEHCQLSVSRSIEKDFFYWNQIRECRYLMDNPTHLNLSCHQIQFCAFYYSKILVLTFNSNTAIPIPDAAPEPANPMKWPLPMLEANREAPTCRVEQLWIWFI